MHNGATVAFGVVDVERDVVLALYGRAVLVIDAHILPLKAQLEEPALGYRHLHPSMLTCHLCLKDVVLSFPGGSTRDNL